MHEQRVAVEPGDMLVLRTGFAEALVQMDGKPDAHRLEQTGAVLDGADAALLDWITDSGVAAICADNYAVEAYPARTSGPGHSILPLHHHCLFKLGVPLAELWYLKDLADWLHAQGRNRFLLTAPPLRAAGRSRLAGDADRHRLIPPSFEPSPADFRPIRHRASAIESFQ